MYSAQLRRDRRARCLWPARRLPFGPQLCRLARRLHVVLQDQVDRPADHEFRVGDGKC